VRAVAVLTALTVWLRRRRPRVVLPMLNYAILLTLIAAPLMRARPRVLPTVSSNLIARRCHARSPRRRLRYAIHAALCRLLLRRADRVIAVSRNIGADLVLRLGVPAERLELIDLAPVVDDDFRRARSRRPAHRWFADGSVPLAVAVGRLEDAKDYPTLLAAMKLARLRRPMRLIVVGPGPLRARLEAMASGFGLDGAVDFVGFVDRPESFVGHADVYVLSSRLEARPTALIEALACGVRVVATRCRHGPEEILEGGRYGRLVPVGDASALADALVSCLEEPADPAGQAHVERRHTHERYAAAYAALLAAPQPLAAAAGAAACP
jgi:glycosyltransferase involved in cell wall biosynthesis